jgi:hypothetical protein
MQNINFGNWQVQIVIGLTIYCIYSLLIPFMFKNFGLRGESNVAIWMIGSAIGLILFAGALSDPIAPETGFKSILLPLGIVLVAGLTLGTLMNYVVPIAFVEAPNPAYPMMALGLSAPIVFLLSPLLFRLAPELFPEASLSLRGMAGIVLGFISIALIAKA